MIDAQGAEREVLLGLDWKAPPDILFFEQDRDGDGLLIDFLTQMGYVYIVGDYSNVVYFNAESVGIS